MSSGLRFVKGSIACQMCGRTDDVRQFEYREVIKKLPVYKVWLVCEKCAKEAKWELEYLQGDVAEDKPK